VSAARGEIGDVLVAEVDALEHGIEDEPLAVSKRVAVVIVLVVVAQDAVVMRRLPYAR
jgi:hypothetical protein